MRECQPQDKIKLLNGWFAFIWNQSLVGKREWRMENKVNGEITGGGAVSETHQMDRIAPGTRVLVTGATGFTGSMLARKLCRMGLDVRAIARGSSNLKPLEDLNIRWFRGNVFDPVVVAEACEGVHYIFHVAAAYREAKYTDDMYRKVHVESTQLLAKKALENPDFRRFVHVSTIGVHGHIPTPPADERREALPIG